MNLIHKRALYKFHGDSNYGTLYGLFIAEKEDVEKIINDKIEIYFGEVLGKHSSVRSNLDWSDIEMVTDDPVVLAVIEENKLCFGYNPVQKWKDDLDDIGGPF